MRYRGLSTAFNTTFNFTNERNKMNECYYHWCRFHHKDEPFCSEFPCKATEKEIEAFAILRLEECRLGTEMSLEAGHEQY